MEFFSFLNLPLYAMQLIQNGMTNTQYYICLGVAGAIYLVSLIFGGLALFAMGTRRNVKHAWLGFLPFANTYYAGKLAGGASFFGQKIKNTGLYAMLFEIAYVAMQVLSVVVTVMLSPHLYHETVISGDSSSLVFHAESVPAGLQWMISARIWVPAVAFVFQLALIVFLCMIYNKIFRDYCPNNAGVLTFVSVLFPIRSFTTFAVRNRMPVDYNEYMRQRIEEIMRRNGMQMPQTPPMEDPFSEFSQGDASGRQGSSQDDPFSEFGSFGKDTQDEHKEDN